MKTLQHVLKKHWGYESFLPLQQEAMQCVLQHRDSVVVLPTGGGKSLCYQAPAACMGGLALVVSPLISLMKDQVDGLTECGVAAAQLNSTLSYEERRQVTDDIRAGRLQLLYAAPERLVLPATIEFLKQVRLSLIAVDEAHCISQWGHDFRPEYRELRRLRSSFPDAGMHAYTATATQRVREDIADQLGLNDAVHLVGTFDRPNLIFRVERRTDRLAQIIGVLQRHPGESGIIYCISRAEVERTAAALVKRGFRARPYHAGMPDGDRQRNQDEFISEEIDIIVATVAFGMGIDKSNVRFVIHAGMPKSIEHYQQESGRAGRDGLEAECCLFYSGGDYVIWKQMMERSPESARAGQLNALTRMYQYCTSVTCRHDTLVRYFGQSLEQPECHACDVCMGDLRTVDDALVISQKIISCVVRLNQRFGGDYTSMVLAGSRDQRILKNGHDQLSTWGLLKDADRKTVRDWIEQLVEQGFLSKTGEYNVLQLTETARDVLRGEATPRLLQPAEKVKPKKRAAASGSLDSWEGVDQGLFQVLRDLRREKCVERGVPAYVVFGDASLRDMARRRPSTLESFLEVHGVGEKKCADYGPEFVDVIVQYCHEHTLIMDVEPA